MTTPSHALLLADGTAGPADDLDRVWPGWSDDVDLVIAADGGARHSGIIGRPIDLWVGDGDSLGDDALAELVAAGVPVERAAIDKDETDAELALLAAIARGAHRITVLGALGGDRFDHALANVWLLAHQRLAGRTVVLLDVAARVRLAGPGIVDLAGRVGDLVSLLPFAGDAAGLVTAGLRYPLRGESLAAGPSRGLSNVRDEPDASVAIESGRLLVVETPARLSE
jgi:thiamine pyrophosphokinase